MDKKLNDLFPSILELFVPEGTEKEITLDGTKVKVCKKDGKFEMEITDEKFDDKDIKEDIKEFKKAIEDLDDDLFLDIVKYVGNTIKLNDFSDLLELPHFNKKLADNTCLMICQFNDLFENFMNSQIDWLRNQRDRYLNIFD